MEKFSAFRDPGTGIQPFLMPVPPLGSNAYGQYLKPFQYLLGTIKLVLVLLLFVLYYALVQVACLILVPIAPVHRTVTWLFTSVAARLILLVIGLWWIPVEVVARKRGRSARTNDSWKPGAGDVIVSNWASWTELLWLAFRFNPIFLSPIPASEPVISVLTTYTPVTHTPGRRTGTGSAAIASSSARAPTPRVLVTGFRQVSLLGMIRSTGHVPSVDISEQSSARSLDDILSKADRPVVLFPECTTSNGRGVLHFSDVLTDLKDKKKMFLMCVRYDPPTNLSPSLTHPIPSTLTFLNPLPHIFDACTSIIPLTMTIRLLSNSGLESFDNLAGGSAAEAEEAIASIGKIKRMRMSWEDKAAFLEFFWGARKSRR